jgi:pimeloyl-ACP methyl ester carboxylesterase
MKDVFSDQAVFEQISSFFRSEGVSELFTKYARIPAKRESEGFDAYYRETVGMLLDDVSAFVLERVGEKLEQERQHELPFHVVAHSMGAIVVNEVFKRSWTHDAPNFKNIVLMGAASSVKEYEDITIPYLLDKKRYGTHLYHLVLHPQDEASESMFYDVIPRGSLLVYIDNYLTTPLTTKDRRIGRFENLMFSLKDTPREALEQISIKVFSGGSGTLDRMAYEDLENNPQRHTEFTPQDFWRESFWRVDEPGVKDEIDSQRHGGTRVRVRR